ncbi:hypothetical protein IW262DRAFT_1370553, partial [Armillaria fumosa]
MVVVSSFPTRPFTRVLPPQPCSCIDVPILVPWSGLEGKICPRRKRDGTRSFNSSTYLLLPWDQSSRDQVPLKTEIAYTLDPDSTLMSGRNDANYGACAVNSLPLSRSASADPFSWRRSLDPGASSNRGQDRTPMNPPLGLWYAYTLRSNETRLTLSPNRDFEFGVLTPSCLAPLAVSFILGPLLYRNHGGDRIPDYSPHRSVVI